MAGDTKTTDQREVVPAPDYSDPFPGIQGTLDEINDQLRGSGSDAGVVYPFADTSAINTPTNLQGGDTWQRLRVSWLVLNIETDGLVTLRIGTRAWLWFLLAGNVVSFPFPIVIERGLDVTIEGDQFPVHAFLIATPE